MARFSEVVTQEFKDSKIPDVTLLELEQLNARLATFGIEVKMGDYLLKDGTETKYCIRYTSISQAFDKLAQTRAYELESG